MAMSSAGRLRDTLLGNMPLTRTNGDGHAADCNRLCHGLAPSGGGEIILPALSGSAPQSQAQLYLSFDPSRPRQTFVPVLKGGTKAGYLERKSLPLLPAWPLADSLGVPAARGEFVIWHSLEGPSVESAC